MPVQDKPQYQMRLKTAKFDYLVDQKEIGAINFTGG
jgi:hypothetical protein